VTRTTLGHCLPSLQKSVQQKRDTRPPPSTGCAHQLNAHAVLLGRQANNSTPREREHVYDRFVAGTLVAKYLDHACANFDCTHSHLTQRKQGTVLQEGRREYHGRWGGCKEEIQEERRLLGCYAVALVRTDVSEELGASIIKVTRIGELGTLAVTSNRRTPRRNTKCGGAKFLRNVGSYKSHTAEHPRRRHSS
jgi:hypothetical protein